MYQTVLHSLEEVLQFTFLNEWKMFSFVRLLPLWNFWHCCSHLFILFCTLFCINSFPHFSILPPYDTSRPAHSQHFLSFVLLFSRFFLALYRPNSLPFSLPFSSLSSSYVPPLSSSPHHPSSWQFWPFSPFCATHVFPLPFLSFNTFSTIFLFPPSPLFSPLPLFFPLSVLWPNCRGCLSQPFFQSF